MKKVLCLKVLVLLFFPLLVNAQYGSWLRSYGLDTRDELLYDVLLDESNNALYVIGAFTDSTRLDTAKLKGTPSTYIAKVSLKGKVQWAYKIYGGEKSYLALDKDKNIIIASGTDDFNVYKYSPQGIQIWFRSVSMFDGEVDGLVVDSNDNITLLGDYDFTISFSNGTGENGQLTSYTNGGTNFLARYDKNGNLLWAKAFGGISSRVNASSLDIDPQNNLYIVFYIDQKSPVFIGNVQFTPPNYNQSVVAKLDNSGNLIWKQFTDLYTLQIKSLPDASYYLRGIGNLKYFNNAGALVWSKETGTRDIDIDASGNLYTVGDAYVAKYSRLNGNESWKILTFSTEGYVTLSPFKKVSVAQDGTTYIAGDLSGEINFGGTVLRTKVTSWGYKDRNILIGKISGTVNPISARYIHNYSYCQSSIVALTDNSQVTGPGNYITNRKWDMGYDNYRSEGTASSYTYDVAGTYRPVLTVTDNLGNTASYMYPLVIKALPLPPAIESLQRYGKGELTFSITTSDYDSRIYRWYDNAVNGNAVHTGKTFSKFFTQPSSTFYVSTADDCESIDRTVVNATILPTDNVIVSTDKILGDNAGGKKMVEDADGNIIVVGDFSESITIQGTTLYASKHPFNYSSDVFIAKFSSDKKLVWLRRAGGEGNDVVQGATTDTQGNIYLTGIFSETIYFGEQHSLTSQNNLPDSYNGYIARYSKEGVAEWAFGITGTNNVIPYDITIDESNIIYLAGTFQTNAIYKGTALQNSDGYYEGFLLKINSYDGSAGWFVSTELTLDSYGSGSDGYLIRFDQATGNLYYTGTLANDAFFVYRINKVDGAKDVVYSPAHYLRYVPYNAAIQDGAMVITGYSPGRNDDYFVTRLELNTGTFTWTKRASGPFWFDKGRGIVITDNDVYVVGSAKDGRFEDFHLFKLYPEDEWTDIFIVRYDFATGAQKFITSFGTNGWDHGNDIIATKRGSLLITGKLRYSPPYLLTNKFLLTEFKPATHVTQANFQFSGTCRNLPVNLRDSSRVNFPNTLKWRWDFGDGSEISTEQNPTHIYVNAGTYTITLTIKDSDNVSSSVSKTIDVNPDHNIPSPVNINLAGSEVITITPSAADNYHWYSSPSGNPYFYEGPSLSKLFYESDTLFINGINGFNCEARERAKVIIDVKDVRLTPPKFSEPIEIGPTPNANAVVVDSNGSTYMAGVIYGPEFRHGTQHETFNDNYDYHLYVYKLDQTGMPQWFHHFPMTTPGMGLGKTVVRIDNSNHLHIATTGKLADANLITGEGTGSFILRLDENGNALNGMRMPENLTILDIAPDGGNNWYLACAFSGSVAFGSLTLTARHFEFAFALLKFSAQDQAQWWHSSNGAVQSQGLGSARILFNSNEEPHVLVYLDSKATFNSIVIDGSNMRSAIVKFNKSSGNPEWGMALPAFTDVDVDSEKNAYIYGSYHNVDHLKLTPSLSIPSGSGSSGAFITTFNLDTHDIKWIRTLPIPFPKSITVDSQKRIYINATVYSHLPFTYKDFSITANGYSDMLLARVEPVGGSVLWFKRLGYEGYEDIQWMHALQDGTITIYGTTTSNPLILDAYTFNSPQPYGTGFLTSISPEPLAANFIENTTCNSLQVKFDNHTFNEFAMWQATSYQWNFGDGQTSTEVSPIHSYAAFGTYNVTLIAYDQFNNQYSNSRSVTVKDTKEITAVIQGAPSTICHGQNVTLTAVVENAGPGRRLEWYNNGALVRNPSGNTYQFNPQSNTTIRLKAIAEAGTCVIQNVKEVEITIPVTPNTSMTTTLQSNKSSYCQGQTAVLTASSSIPGSSFQWYRNNILQSHTAEVFNVLVFSSDTYKVVINASASVCVLSPVSERQIIVVGSALTSMNITLSADKSLYCEGNSAVLSAGNFIAGSTFTWYRNNQLQNVITNSFLTTPLNAEKYKVVVTAPSGTCLLNMQSEKELTVSVQVRKMPTLQLTSDKSSYCPDDLATLKATIVDMGNPVFEWSINNVKKVNSLASLTYVPTNGDIVKVNVTAPTGLCVAESFITKNISIVVSTKQTLDVSLTTDQRSYCLGSDAIVTAHLSSISSNQIYSWVINEKLVEGAKSAILQTKIEKPSIVTFRVNDPSLICNVASQFTAQTMLDVKTISPSISLNGGTLASTPANSYQWYLNDHLIPGMVEKELLVNESGTYYVVVTKEGCTMQSNSIDMLISGIEFHKAIANAAPNPFTDYVTISFPEHTIDLFIEIYSVTGKKIYSHLQRTSNSLLLNDLDWNSGVYLMKITHAGKEEMYKLIKY